MAGKYYAVRSGRNPGIYDTWGECKKQVHKCKGAEFKSFTTRAAAERYMGIEPACKEKEEPLKEPHVDMRGQDLTAYVDGSFMDGAFSYGCIIISSDGIRQFSEAFYRHPDASMRNVAGELHGAMKAIAFALETGAASLEIYYDYAGIGAWADGEWKANKPGTIAYKKYVAEARKTLPIRFCKVQGHSGDKWNERADGLAREALGI